MDPTRLHDEAYRWEIVATLMQEHGEALTQYCRTWVGEALAEELVLEVFLTAWQGLPQYRPEATLRTWLFGIARNKCQQTYRNRARRQAIAMTFAEEIRARAQAAVPLAPGESPEHEPMLARLERSLAKLPREERLIVTLRYWQELPLQDIAVMLHLSSKTIQRRLRSAEQRLKELMDAPSEP